MNGAATNPDFDVVARAAVQIKNAIDATIELVVRTTCSGADVKVTCHC